MGRRRPSALVKPGEGITPTKNRIEDIQTGNLKGKWTAMVMTHEDTKHRYKQLWWFLIIIFGILDGIPSLLILIAFFFVDDILLKWISGVTGIVGLLFYSGLFIWFTWWLLSPNSMREVALRPRNLKERDLLSGVKEFCDSIGIGYKVLKTKNYLPRRYLFDNGVEIKISLIRLVTQPNGSILIRYRPPDWEEALELQLAMDEFCVRKGIAQVKRSK